MRIFVNGQRVDRFEPGTYLDHYIIEGDLTGLLKIGENRIEVETWGHLYETPNLGHPMTLVGRFAVCEDESGVALLPEAGCIKTGDWSEQGYNYYSGIGIYTQRFGLPKTYVGKRLILSMDRPGDLADVYVNDQPAGLRAWEPWEVDITKLVKPGQNALTIKVANSLQNLLCQTPKASGILGEVRIAAYEP